MESYDLVQKFACHTTIRDGSAMLYIVSLSAKHCYQHRYELSLLVLVKRAQEDVCFDGLGS